MISQLPRGHQRPRRGGRIEVFNPQDAEELAAVNRLPDQFVIEAASADPRPEYKLGHWVRAAVETSVKRRGLPD